MSFYRKDKLLQVAGDRGYTTIRAIAAKLAPLFGVTREWVERKLKNGDLSAGECEVIGAYFEMTMREYYDVFMNGLFRVDEEGHWVAHIDSPYLHLHPPKEQKKPTRASRKGKERKQTIHDDNESVTQTKE